MKYWKLVSLVQFVVIVDLIQTVCTTVLTQNGNADFTGVSFKMDCVTDALDASVQISDPSGVIAANCLIPTGSTPTCLPGTDSNYVASQDVASKTTSVTISTTSRASHEGGWTCTKLGTTPVTKSVTVLTVGTLSEPSPVPNFEVTTSTSKTMTVGVACVYPSAQITWEFVTDTLASTGVNSTGTCTNSGPTGGSCLDAAANSSSCTFEVSPTSTDGLSAGTYKLKANLVVVGEVASTGVSRVLSTVITISGPTTTTTTTTPTTTTITTPTTTTTTPTTTTTTPTTTTTTPTTTTTTPTTTPTTTTTTPTTTTTTTPTITTTPPTTITTPTTTSSGFTDAELGAIIGGIVGGVFLLCLVGLAVFCYRVQSKESSEWDHKRRDQWDRRDASQKPRRGDNPKGPFEKEKAILYYDGQDQRNRRNKSKPRRGDNPKGPIEKEKVIVYHNGQAYWVDPKHHKDYKKLQYGYDNKGYYNQELPRHHNSMGRTRSNGHHISSHGYRGQKSNSHFVSSQSYRGRRSDSHFVSPRGYGGQKSNLGIYQPNGRHQSYSSEFYDGGNVHYQHGTYPEHGNPKYRTRPELGDGRMAHTQYGMYPEYGDDGFMYY